MNIVFFTSHYPNPYFDNHQTKADHYFAREWVKAGHKVVVIHNDFELFYRQLFLKKAKESSLYTLENVSVFRIKIVRYFPRSRFVFKNTFSKAKKSILKFLQLVGIEPDVIFVDFCLSQWRLIEKIKCFFKCDIIPIFNKCDLIDRKEVARILSQSWKVGARSQSISDSIKKIDRGVKTFIIYSGAPTNIELSIKNQDRGDRHEKTFKILFVGNLISLKNVDVIIRALNFLKEKYSFILTIIGSGPRGKKLKAMVKTFSLESKVSFKGKCSREEVLDFMKQSDCFVMVSSPESFGIVYVEAMACGCYVIASVGEGIDGVIINDYNGALIKPRDVNELITGFEKFFNLETTVLDTIIIRALNTSKLYREDNVAQRFLDDALSV